jgi:hypothetical protein
MRHKLFSASCMVTIAVIGAAPAYANPAGHGNTCEQASPSGNPTQLTPGNSATSPGSVHNEPGINSPNGGNGGTAYNTAQANNKVGATSQYDTSCAKVTAASTNNPNSSAGTLTPPGTPLQMATNNAKATRPISHTGGGTTK